MPKKSRRSKERKRAKQAQIARERGSQPAAPAVVVPAVAAPAVAAVPPKMKISKAPDLALRYGYVMADLRRVGILTGIMLLILLVLSFIIG